MNLKIIHPVKPTHTIHHSNMFHRLSMASMQAAFASVLALSLVSLASAELILRGNVGSRIIDDNVAIADNTRCTLNGNVIKSKVRILGGASPVSSGATVDGNLQAGDSKLVDFKQNTEVKGDV